jgi:hypothetical protein
MGHARSVNLIRYLTSYAHSSPKRLLKFRQRQCVSQRETENFIAEPEKKGTFANFRNGYSLEFNVSYAEEGLGDP